MRNTKLTAETIETVEAWFDSECCRVNSFIYDFDVMKNTLFKVVAGWEVDTNELVKCVKTTMKFEELFKNLRDVQGVNNTFVI